MRSGESDFGSGRPGGEHQGEVFSTDVDVSLLNEELFSFQYFLRAFFFIATPVLILLVVYNLTKGRIVEVVLLCSLVILLLWVYFAMRKSKSESFAAAQQYRIYQNFIRGFLFVFIMLTLFTVGWRGELDRVLWSYIFPIASFLYLGRKEGFYWAVFFLGSMALILFYPRPQILPSDAFLNFKLIYLISFSIMCAMGIAGKIGIQFTYSRFVHRENQLVESEKKYREAYERLQREMGERQQAQQALAESEEKYRRIFENSIDVIYSIDMELRTIDVSPSIKGILGYSPSELIGRPIRELGLMTPESLECALSDAAHVLGGSPIQTPSYTFIAKDGTSHCAEVSGAPIRREGSVVGMILVARDITDRKQVEEEKRKLEERLQRSEKMEALGQMAGGVAHDLNNVLGVLSGYSELLLLETPEGSPTRGHAETILQSTVNGAAIIQDLLTVARRSVTATDVINLNSIISDFLKTPVFERIKDYHPRVTFRTECDKELLNIMGSSVHMGKTVMNLVSNAAEAISGNGEVVIRTENHYLDSPLRGYEEIKHGDYVVLTVSDTGMGIPAESIGKIFEPFYTKKKMGRSGTGLGLAIVWGTVKDHNGYIDVQTGVGQGTTFTLYFPVTRAELIAPQQKEPIERYMGKGESVLVVDDIAQQRNVAAGMLTRLGYNVHAVSSGEEAVEYLKGNKADILVLDMIMAPGIGGLETYRRVIEIRPGQKAIIVSGFSETDQVKEAQKLGAGAYVKKPYMLEKIGVAIRDELNR
jgi:PAS domain S-box-containing protein